MNILQYKLNRLKQSEQAEKFRDLCANCLQSPMTCYCAEIRSFDPEIRFVILIHPKEFRRRIATGRMAHLSLQDSFLIAGENYSTNAQIDKLIADQNFKSVLLYPTKQATNISNLQTEDRQQFAPKGKKLQVFVIDGTWATARKTYRLSHNLRQLPQITFSISKKSNFRVRKQPADLCFSTLEAIHQTIEEFKFKEKSPQIVRPHDQLLQVFDFFVNRQLSFVQKVRRRLGVAEKTSLRRRTTKSSIGSEIS